MKNLRALSWLLPVSASVILLQTLYFKFTGHPQSLEIFTKLGVEPWGRIVVGIIELIVGIMLLLPFLRFYGAICGIGLMKGAIGSHILTIGIESNMDSSLLFSLAILVLIFCLMLTLIHRKEDLSNFKRIIIK